MTIAAQIVDTAATLDAIAVNVGTLEANVDALTKERDDLKAKLAALTAAGALAVAFVPANGFGNWKPELSGPKESCTMLPDHVVCKAGGNAANASGTHYARIRYYLPENDDFAAFGAWSLEATFELPADYYTRKQSYLRLMTTDNYVGKYRSTGKAVGCSNGNEWRVGLVNWGTDDLPRLVSGHQGGGEYVLWTGTTKLTTGKHTVRIDFTPGYNNDGAWAVTIDGFRMGGGDNVPTVPSSVPKAEAVVTRVGAGLDGAAKQNTKSIEESVYGIKFEAKKAA